MRIVIVVSHPIQYFTPIYREIAKFSDLSLTVFFHSRLGLDSYFDDKFGKFIQWDIPLLNGYPYYFLSDKSNFWPISFNIVHQLIKKNPDVIILNGYNSLINITAWITGKLIGSKVMIRGDTRLTPLNSHSLIKSQLKRLMFRFADGFLSIGQLNRAYFEALGVPSKKIFFAPFCVDNSKFNLGNLRNDSRKKFRSNLNLSLETKVILFVGKLVPGKRPGDIIVAMSRLRENHQNIVLVVVGSGELEDILRTQALEYEVNVLFLGFKNQSELPEIYAGCDIFVFPATLESWGLVVNEAMAAGMPVIVSDDVGAASDLVRDRSTGIVFPAKDIGRLTAAIDDLLSSPELAMRFGANSQDVINSWSVEACAIDTVFAATDILSD